MDFLPEEIEEYAIAATSPESAVLKRLNRETNLKVMMPRMLSGHMQGRILSLYSKLMQPKSILEIGTYTGYSAICLAEGLAEDGKLLTIDINDELTSIVKKYIAEADLEGKIIPLTGDARDLIPEIEGPFDIVFIDADKKGYSTYFDLVIDKIRPGGIIIADNVLWSGKVVGEKKDKDTQAILDYTEKVKKDPRVENLLLPVRDGLLISRRK